MGIYIKYMSYLINCCFVGKMFQNHRILKNLTKLALMVRMQSCAEGHCLDWQQVIWMKVVHGDIVIM